MSVLKVVKAGEEVIEKKDEVVAGQVRIAKESTSQHEVVVLIVDARYSPADGSEEEPFIAVVLNSSRPTLVNKIEQRFGTNSAERIRDLFPIVLDATLTYKEAE